MEILEDYEKINITYDILNFGNISLSDWGWSVSGEYKYFVGFTNFKKSNSIFDIKDQNIYIF